MSIMRSESKRVGDCESVFLLELEKNDRQRERERERELERLSGEKRKIFLSCINFTLK